MNPHSVIADSDESAVVGPQTNANQAGSSSCEVVPPVEPSPAHVTPHRDEPDESDKCLTVERPASDSGQVSASVIRSAERAKAPGEASANTTAAVAERPKTAWPLTLGRFKRTLVRLLRETRGNRRRTAILLGISRSTLYRMLARYGIDHVGRAASSRQIAYRPRPCRLVRLSRSPKHSHRPRLGHAVCPGRNGDGFRSTIRTRVTRTRDSRMPRPNGEVSSRSARPSRQRH